MKLHPSSLIPILCACLMASALAYSPNPDLTAAGAIAALKTDPDSSPVYGETYNLGATGLRGWIYIDRNNVGAEGLQTDQSRQILVTVASTPGSAVLAVDDVILGAMAGSSGTVPSFTGDCRKAFGVAIGEAEKTGAGTLRVKRWRAGTTTDVNIAMTIMGNYTATAPYSCPKSALILSNAIAKLEQETLSGGWADAVSGLALLAAVKPGDANYATVQTKLQNFAHTLAPANLSLTTDCDTWNWGYIGIFLSEYYLRTVADGTPDASVLHGINEYTVGLAKSQSMYGTFGHGGAQPLADGSLHGSISWYGPVNSAGLVANIAIVIGKKALLAGGRAIDPEIDPAIDRGSKFFAYFVNKGGIGYGEHEPWPGGHASNGKDPMAAVLFGLQDNQDNKPVETEYFTRMSVAGFVGREFGHTGQGFSYIWTALGAAMGGDAAAVAHLNQVRWHLDLERRTDGSFVYDGGEQYGGNYTSTYLGSSSYNGLSPNACYVLTYALPLKRLHITGRNANPANTLDAAKVANAIAAATYERDCVGYSVATLMTALSEYDPVLRHDAAAELAKRSLTTTEENTLIAMITNGTMSSDANVRQGACETLGIRKTTGALAALSQRLSDTDLWVRGKAGNALRNFGAAASGQITPMLTAFVANATDPDVIDWDDPIQFANGFLADTLFQTLEAYTVTADKQTLLYPALRAALNQPSGLYRAWMGNFIKNRLTLTDVQAVAPALVAAAAERSPADQMFSDGIRHDALETLAKFKIEEAIPLCLLVKEQTWAGDDWLPFDLLQNTYGTAAKEVLPTLYEWRDHLPVFQALGYIGGCCPGRYETIEAKIHSTIAVLESNAQPPALNYFKTVDIVGNTPVDVNSRLLTASASDLDGGVPTYIWSKVSGPGNVTFSPNGTTASSQTVASFETPGVYVLRVAVSDSSIMNEVLWWKPDGVLGYYDFQTYDHDYGLAYSTSTAVELAPGANWPPVAYAQQVGTDVSTSRGLTLVGFDFEGGPLNFAIMTPPVHGTLSGTAPNVTYAPAPGYAGPDSFTFKVTDSGGLHSETVSVSIEVRRPPVPINVNIDRTVRTGLVGPAGGLGAVWNTIQAPYLPPVPFSVTNLLLASGPASTVGLTIPYGFIWGVDSWGSPSLGMLREGAVDFNNAENNAQQFVINGLDPAKTYDLYIASANLEPSQRHNGVWSTTNTTTTPGDHPCSNVAELNGDTWVEGNNYVLFKDVVPDGAGNITVNGRGIAIGDNKHRSPLSGFQLVELPPEPRAVPNGLSATPGDARVELTWDAVPFATSYLVKRSNTPGGPYTVRANPAVTYFLDAPAANGTTWYYVVSAVDAYGQSSDSAEVSVIPSNDPPPVISTYSPADNATGVAVGANLVATFNENIVRGTGNITLKNLTDATQTTIAVTDAQVSISGATLTINPTENLLNSKSYAVQIAATCIDDTTGNSFAGITNDTTWNFTTANVYAAPPVTTGLKLHLDASQLTGLINGNAVTSWTDMSGLGNHATATAGTPIYKTGVLNGKPVIRFNDGSSFTTADLSSQFPTAATGFIVTTISNDSAYTLVKANPGVDEWWCYYANGLSYPGFFRSSRIEGYCPMPNSGSHLFAISSSASAWEMSINGVSQGVQGGNYSVPGEIIIGNGSSGGGLNGDIAEVLIYSRVLTATEANLVGSYLSGKYGLATSYDSPPVISTYDPADNATGVAVGANLVATFSENIVKGTGNITLKNLTDGSQTTIAVTDAQVTVSGATLTVNPTANLAAGKNYAVQIAATAIKDPANNAFAGITNDTSWNFTTLTDYAVWAATFAGANLTDPNADFDGDRTSNDYERIWGLNPTNAASRNAFTSLSGLANGTFRYTRRVPSLSGLSYTVWTSTNLTTWTLDTGAVQTPAAPVAEVETVTVNLSLALLGGPRLFVRMRAAR